MPRHLISEIDYLPLNVARFVSLRAAKITPGTLGRDPGNTGSCSPAKA
jgi:hypothetical protein